MTSLESVVPLVARWGAWGELHQLPVPGRGWQL